MQKRDSNQHSVPDNTPDRSIPDPKLPGEGDENIIKGANQQDQLDQLKPAEGDDKASNKLGSPPLKNDGEGNS